ncbi:extradiol ring-cleavage dioxygenase [Phyllobacterium endophyticum]|uniref:DODA-type extradiol aromatic ring-opening family dioxygenase n=1 Tax=Phyllobacterium endophyticum TaxID=1149773 RepID=UPI001474CF36|nr:extradiol ring-cleavage dioxygenase [Phyllobacterium endophyticum]MBB3237237.1 protocatechuate 4,5-dioxygenase beta chain [Phyllobacterium endophyticum]
MAELVAVYAVPHTPSFVADAQRDGENSEAVRYFAEIRNHLEASKPDVIVTVNNDHFNTFFFDNWPTFAIGTAEMTAGPNDQTPGMPWYNIRVEATAAKHILSSLIGAGFDFSSTVDFEIDHGALVPLHFLTPKMHIPIVPIFVNCVVPPLPAAQRCFALGRALAEAIRSWDKDARVVIVTSGSLSLEIGGPRVEVDKTFGVPDPAWAAWILEEIRGVRYDEILSQASEPRMLQAGNVAGELLNWIIALGTIKPSAPTIMIDQPQLGNAFAAWDARSER